MYRYPRLYSLDSRLSLHWLMHCPALRRVLLLLVLVPIVASGLAERHARLRWRT